MESLPNQEQITPNTSEIKNGIKPNEKATNDFEMQLNELGFTDAEEKLFRIHDEDLTGSPQDHVQTWLPDAYYDTLNQNEELKTVLGYIKRNLQNVAKNRGLSIDPEIRLDEDLILTDITMPKKDYGWNESESFEGFGPEQYKDQQKLVHFFTVLTVGMSAADTEKVAYKLSCMNHGFKEVMTQYIPKIIDNIDNLVYENDLYLLGTNGNYITIPITDDELIDFNDDESINPENLQQENYNDNEIRSNQSEVDFDNIFEDSSSISDENLLNYLKFVNTLPQLIEWQRDGGGVIDRLYKLAQEKKLDEFRNNKEFMEKLAKIMTHDKGKHTYYFHGTQDLRSAHSIIQQGLGMTRDDIKSTAYPEFSMDDVILYERGFANEIGHDAIVLIDIPLDEKGKPRNIIEKKPSNYKLSFVPSGLQGLNGRANYFIRPEHIVGIIDKENKNIIFNQKYREDD